QLERFGFDEEEIRELWSNTGEDYFLRERTEDIVWHTQAIAAHGDSAQPLVLIRDSSDLLFESATQVFVRARHRPHIFALLASAMEQLDLSIQDARLYNSGTGFILYTFFVLDASGQPINDDPARLEHIRQVLTQQLNTVESFPEL